MGGIEPDSGPCSGPPGLTRSVGKMFSSMTNDRVTLVKKDGTVVKENIPATVSSKKITTFRSQ